MNKTILAALIVGLTLAATSPAAAQAPVPATLFVDVNAAAQTQSRTIETSTSFPLYGETAVVNAAQGIDGGFLFDVSGGYRFKKSYGVAIGVSAFSKSGDGSLVASIPSPIAFNRSVTSTTNASDLKHSEIGTHVMFVYFAPVTDKVDVSISAGPSFFSAKQDVLSATVPAGTQTANVAKQSEKGSAAGGNFGLSVNYLVTPNYGAGVFMRYAGASVDFDSASDVKVGGFQLGGGLRVRF